MEKFKEENVDGIEIISGIKCNEYRCEHFYRCSRRGRFNFHNFRVELKRKTGIQLPIYHSHKIYENLSGTKLCPKITERIYTCWDCESCGGNETCTNKQRHEAIINGTYDYNNGFESRCQYFEISEYGNSWDRNTGERIF